MLLLTRSHCVCTYVHTLYFNLSIKLNVCTCLLVATDDAECGTSICVCERKAEDLKTTFLRCTVFPTLFLPLTSVSPIFLSHCLCILFTPLPPSLHTPPALSSHPSPFLHTPLLVLSSHPPILSPPQSPCLQDTECAQLRTRRVSALDCNAKGTYVAAETYCSLLHHM